MRTRHGLVGLRFTFAIAVWMLLITALPVFAQISVNIATPIPGSFQGGPLTIIATVSSASEVTSVQASIGSRNTALTFSSGSGTWTGTLSLDGLARGPLQLVVTATNAAAQSVQATRDFIYDKLPVLTLTAPIQFAIGQPDLRVTATCVDDGPVCRITVTSSPQDAVLAMAEGAMDQSVRPPDGAPLVTISVTDSTGRSNGVVRQVYIQSNGHFRPVATFSGTILAIDAGRALVLDTSVSPNVVRLVNRSTNAIENVYTVPDNTEIKPAFLTPLGAMFASAPLAATATIFEWRSGGLVNLGLGLFNSLVVKGAWALWSTPLPCCSGGNTLTLRDLTTGTNHVHSSTTANNFRNDVTPAGHAIFSDRAIPANPTPHEIFEFDPGPPPVTTKLTAGAPLSSVFPVSDGVNVVFMRLGAPPGVAIILRTSGGTEVVLATAEQEHELDSYKVAGGWTAFRRKGAANSIQAWLRAPDGTETQLSSTGGVATIEALTETGEVMFTAPATGATRFLARPGQPTLDLGAASGTPVWIDNAWYLQLGSNLLAFEEAPARSILSEGATGTFFTTDVAILNPTTSAVPVTITYLRDIGPQIQETRTLPAQSRTTIRENTIPGLENAAVSTIVDAPAGTPLVVDRLMTWDATGYGGHLGSAVPAPRTRWLFAEGAQGFFNTFFLLANSGSLPATVRFTFLIEQGSPFTQVVTVDPSSRKTISAGDIAALVNQSFSTVIESSVPIVAERAMYFGAAPLWYGGHGTAGVNEPARQWFHAEGATGAFFDTFILIANPNPVEVVVNVTFITDANQRIIRTKTLAPNSRLTVNIEDEGPELANVAVSTYVSSILTPQLPIVSERAMYWGPPGGAAAWRETHASFGVTSMGAKWGLAEGRVGGPRQYQTYILVSNDRGTPAPLRVTYLRENGTPVERFYEVGPQQRLNINASDVPELANSNFSTIVESINGVEINVESAIYWNVNGVTWEGGGNTVATRLP